MSTDPQPVLDHLDADLDAALERLMTLLRIPSISTDPAFKDACREAAEWVVADLQSLGAEASLHETPGHPMVVGTLDGAADGPHLLFYGHYDVQPVDPLDLWDRDPFDPQVEEEPSGRRVIRGRGAGDDKGQFMTFLEAIRAWRAVHGTLPCRITFFFEGEEESGSPSLVPFLKAQGDLLKADLALICDTGLFDSRVPAIVTTLRGLLGEAVTLNAADKDLHSGLFGGAAINPIHVLAGIIDGLHDDTGRITLPGFYDGVSDTDPAILAQWERMGFDPQAFLGEVGLSTPAGERDRSALEQLWARPTCDVNGIWGGYTGAGFKTVLPAQAHAKISFRLVGQQDPQAIRDSFRAYVRDQLPPDVEASFTPHSESSASIMATDHPAFNAARRALSDEWPDPAAFVGGGGSIPVAGHFQSYLGMDSMLIGFGRDDDQIHSPNEKYDLESFTKGARSWVRILAALS